MKKTIFCLILLSSVAFSQTKTERSSFFDVNGMNTTVSPGDDFFEYANGKWFADTNIPDTQSGWGSFYMLYDESSAALRKILEKASATKSAKGSLAQKVGDFYLSGMDSLGIEKLGYQPIKSELAKIDAIKNYHQLLEYMAADQTNRGGELISYGVNADQKDASKNAFYINQGGTHLPSKEYYTNTDAKSVAIREGFKKYIAQLFTLTGVSADMAKAKAESILAFETALASSHRTPVELRDPEKNYNKYSLEKLTKEMPNLNWPLLLAKFSLPNLKTVIVGQPEYYKKLNDILGNTDMQVLKDYTKFGLIASAANKLSHDFVQARFDFVNKTLYGQPKLQDRWKRMSQNTNNNLSELLGQLYVKEYFTPDAKKRMLALVNNLQVVYKDRIEKLDWMSDATKKKALQKLASFTKKIGYPDKWKNYDDVKIDKNTFYENLVQVQKHDTKENLAKVGKPVDKSEWGMTPSTINAYYNPLFNEIVFPAGILQFPFFDPKADDAINYGAIGAVIGHEMTHGFDDEGRQFDYQGNMKDWWQKADADKFKLKAQKVVEQYNKYTVYDSLHVNGELTLGENLADFGGVTLAYNAFLKTPEAKNNVKIDGFTPMQRFFLGYAQVWRIKDREESMRTRIATDPHSPERFRVNGPLSNFTPFYEAYGVKAGNKMYKPENERITIW